MNYGWIYPSLSIFIYNIEMFSDSTDDHFRLILKQNISWLFVYPVQRERFSPFYNEIKNICTIWLSFSAVKFPFIYYLYSSNDVKRSCLKIKLQLHDSDFSIHNALLSFLWKSCFVTFTKLSLCPSSEGVLTQKYTG